MYHAQLKEVASTLFPENRPFDTDKYSHLALLQLTLTALINITVSMNFLIFQVLFSAAIWSEVVGLV